MRGRWRLLTLLLLAAAGLILLLWPRGQTRPSENPTASDRVAELRKPGLAARGKLRSQAHAPSDTEEEAEDGHHAAIRRVVIRDLRTSDPVVGFEALVVARDPATGKRTEYRRRTDASGFLGVPSTGLRAIRAPRGSRWMPSGQSVRQIVEAGECWVYEKMRVHVRVFFDPLSQDPTLQAEASSRTDRGRVARRKRWPRGEQIAFVALQPIEHGIPKTVRAPGDRHWLWRHGMGQIHLRSRDLAPSGTVYELEIARLNGYVLGVHLLGWRTPGVALDADRGSHASPQLVDVVLRRATRISGVLRDENSRPLRGATIKLRTVSCEPAEPSAFATAQLQTFAGAGVSMLTDQITGVTRILSRQEVVTNQRGEYEVFMPLEDQRGEFSVHLPRRPPHSLDTGPIDGDREGLDITAPARLYEIRRAEVRLGGKRLTAGMLIANDITGQLHRSWRKSISPDGRITTEWFEVQRRYNIMVLGVPGRHMVSRFVKWDGRKIIDLDQLPSTERR